VKHNWQSGKAANGKAKGSQQPKPKAANNQQTANRPGGSSPF
jgi:hypothetical protein